MNTIDRFIFWRTHYFWRRVL